MPKGRGTAAALAKSAEHIRRDSTNGGPAVNEDKNGTKAPLVKTTLFIPDVLDANLAYMSLQTRQSKAELVRQAVEKYLEEKRYDPRKKPKVAGPTYD